MFRPLKMSIFFDLVSVTFYSWSIVNMAFLIPFPR